MVLRDDIAAAKKKMALTWGANREIRRLETYLHSGEKVESIVSGRYSLNGRGILVLTNERVLFVKDGWFNRVTQDFIFHAITSVEWKGSMMFGRIIIFGDGSEAEISRVFSWVGADIAKAIRGRAGRRLEPQQAQGGQVVADDFTAQLERLSTLLSLGRITQAEYDQGKQKLLAG